MVAWTPLVDMRLELGAMERIEREREGVHGEEKKW